MRKPRPARLAAALATTTALTVGTISAATFAEGSPRVPTPESVIGWEPCADYKLATSEQLTEYYRKLDDASDRIKVVDIGKSSKGRPMIMALISSADNLKPKNLQRFKDISRRLATDGNLSKTEANKLAEKGKSVAWVDFGLHSVEVAGHQAGPLFTHRLVTGESEEMRRIRDDVITIVMPNMNPDGTTMVADWYRKQLGTKFEHTNPPELYNKYGGHDNNRDWYMYNLPETRNIGRQLYHEWFPQLVHNVHQHADFPSRITVPPFKDPVNPAIQPEVVRGVNLVGDAMGRRLEAEGKVGALSANTYDMWWNGGMRSAPYYHNMVGILTETAHAWPSPATYDPKDFPKTFANGESTKTPSIFYPSPWKGGKWNLRQSCEYISTASMAMVDEASQKRADWLRGMHRMGQQAVKAGANETYVVPADQVDLPTAVKMVNVLRRGGVEVERATKSFTAGERTYPAGSFLIRGAQTFRPYLDDLLNPQQYPDRRQYPDGPPDPPYDITGWTLPMQMGVTVDKYQTRINAATKPVDQAAVRAGSVSDKAVLALDPRVNNSVLAVNRLLAAGATVSRSTASVTTNAGKWPAGTFLVPAKGDVRKKAAAQARQLGLNLAGVDKVPDSARKLTAPRVGLYYPWGGALSEEEQARGAATVGGGSRDEGWTRYTLEKFGFNQDKLTDQKVRAGNLKKNYDVIVLPDASYAALRDGQKPGSMPEEYTGGMTEEGVAHLKEFVKQGGTLVTFNNAEELARKGLGVPVKDVTEGKKETEFFAPGTLLNMQFDANQPIAWGMPEKGVGFFSYSPAFEVAAGADSVQNVARYPSEKALASGWILGEQTLHNRSAAVDAKIGDGHAVLLGFRPQNRSQTHGTFKLLFNALYLGSMSK
ncbi:M14 family metallopeptidase [Streptomyces sp. NBC_00299]|uniref:M14 family metallopeptidase n=1 Tax=Streptomyces sp. NBC_00299 TaxID=2975705 RepID=UPI002E29397C|nr:M14 metallopeptidase family protein [Streptomyces sp. NBC_00299]